MTRIVKKEAKTIDEAVRLALDELGVPAERAMVDVLEEGKPGLFGLGAKNALVEVSYEETVEDLLLAFLRPILDSMGISPEITLSEAEGQILVNMQGENSGIAIGRRGETLDALQYLTSLVINRGSEGYTRVVMDVSDYRLKREETLVHLAQRVAEKVQKTHRNVTLEPMNPYERRIIHSALQGVADVETGSVGEEPNRKVVVRSTHPGAGGQESDVEPRSQGGFAGRGVPRSGPRDEGRGAPRSGPREENRGAPRSGLRDEGRGARRSGPRDESHGTSRGGSYGESAGESTPRGDFHREPRQVGFGSRAPGFNPSSPHENPNSYRNRSTERIGYVGNPTASGTAKKPEEPAFKPYDIEDEIGPQE